MNELSKNAFTLVSHTSQAEAANQTIHICHSCQYAMPSETSTTGLRCGYQYFLIHPLLRKLTRMDHFPEVSEIYACAQWHEKHETKTA